MFRLALGATTLVSLALFAATPGQAQVSGTIWLGDMTNSATFATCTACTAANLNQANFTVGAGGINFHVTDSDNQTVSQFLNGAALSNASVGSMTMDNAHVRLTGTLGLQSGANAFQVGHDDGVVLSIVGFGTVLNVPGPTAFSLSPFNVNNPGAAGNFAFTLDYNECCDGPADLQFAINNVVVGVPEPATWGMMLLGFAGLGFAFHQSRRKVSFA
jgi:opacity protein-like surface antigen